MGNQQLSSYRKGIKLLAKNAKLGDGYFSKHPECVNYKITFTSTTPELLEAKRTLCPEIFGVGVKMTRKANAKNCYKNAKPLYGLTSFVKSIFNVYKHMPYEELYTRLTIADFGLWYLDDGGIVDRSKTENSNSYRPYICIGNCCNTKERTAIFIENLHRLFGSKIGGIRPNNSKATENNKTWYMPRAVAEEIIEKGLEFYAFPNKIPYRWKKFNGYPQVGVGN